MADRERTPREREARALRAGSLLGAACALLLAACASAPPAPPPVPTITVDQKMAWILRLENQRILRAAAEPIAAPVPAPPARKRRNASPAPVPVAAAPDLTELLKDSSAAIRRRAALAIGRVGLSEGVAPLEATLADANADVRQMAAFALGLLADKSAAPALTTALQDPDPLVRARAAEALGLIGDSASAPAVGQMVSAFIKAGALATVQPDDEQWPMTPHADAVRLGLFALVRQKSWDALQSTALDPSGQPVSDWWPIAYALQRINDPRAAPALRRLLGSPGRYTRAFAARGLGGLKDQASAPLVIGMLQHAGNDVALQVSAIRALAQIGGPTAAPAIVSVLTADGTDPNAALEAVTALGDLKDAAALPYIQDRLTDDWPTMRAAAIRAASTIDPQGFLTVLSGLEPDRQWVVRAAVARVLASAP
ncbi:MAG TPA: HEAT repeat domain-containing protein, partial [Vicinamibacterales bacterium]